MVKVRRIRLRRNRSRWQKCECSCGLTYNYLLKVDRKHLEELLCLEAVWAALLREHHDWVGADVILDKVLRLLFHRRIAGYVTLVETTFLLCGFLPPPAPFSLVLIR